MRQKDQEISSTDVSEFSYLKLQVLQTNLQNAIIFTGTNVSGFALCF